MNRRKFIAGGAGGGAGAAGGAPALAHTPNLPPNP
jgi:hypothetical protein